MTTIVNSPEQLELKLKSIEGSMSIYSKIVNLSKRTSGSVHMGLEGSWASHANIASPVNYDSKFEFKSGDQTEPIKLKFSEIDLDSSDYELSLLIMCKESISKQDYPSNVLFQVS